MKAKPGDWLIVAAKTDHASGRRGEIVSVGSPSGEPPFVVHWVDTGQSTLVIPGADATVVTATDLAKADDRASRRFVRHASEDGSAG
jgi:hypothetical protein